MPLPASCQRSGTGSARASACRFEKCLDLPRVLARRGSNTSHRLSARRVSAKATAHRACAIARRRAWRMSVARRCSLMSGWRRMMPVAEHGASSRMRSKATPSHHCDGVAPHRPRRVRRARPSRSRFSRTRASREASESSAVTRASARSSRCAVLPPGAAQASRMRSPSLRIGQRRGELRGAVLHGKKSLGEARQLGDIATVVENDRVGQRIGRVRRRRRRRADVAATHRARCAAVGAKPQRRFGIVRGGDVIATIGMSRRGMHRAATPDARCA